MGDGVITTTHHFRAQMKRLMGLRFVPADLTTHWEALQRVTEIELSIAVDRAQRDCEHFPAPQALLAFVDEWRSRPTIPPDEDRSTPVEPTVAVLEALGATVRIPVTREWRFYCPGCRDSGWRTHWCGADEDPDPPLERTRGTCGQPRSHTSHEWVAACPCASSNPAVQRRRTRAQQTTRARADR